MEGALVQGPVFSQALAMSQDHWSPYLCGRKALLLAFKGVRVKEKWASRHFVMKANFRTVMVEISPTHTISARIGEGGLWSAWVLENCDKKHGPFQLVASRSKPWAWEGPPAPGWLGGGYRL